MSYLKPLICISKQGLERRLSWPGPKKATNPDMRTTLVNGRSIAAAAFVLVALAASPAAAESGLVRIAEDNGVAALPIRVAIERKLIERHAKGAGMAEIKVETRRYESGIAVSQAVLSGQADFGVAGTTVMLALWDRTRGTEFEVRGAIALVAMPLKFITADARINGIRDYDGNADHRIAVPEARISLHAAVLRMGAEKVFGLGQAFRLDHLMFVVPPAPAHGAILGNRKTAHTQIAALPYSFEEIANGRGRAIANSFEIVGGAHTAAVFFSSRKWKEKNPKLFQAVVAAGIEAQVWLSQDSSRAARFYKGHVKTKRDIAEFEAMFAGAGEIDFAPTPRNTLPFARFLERTGAIKAKATNWTDYFWESAHGFDGG